MAGYDIVTTGIHLLTRSVYETADTCHRLYHGSEEMQNFAREMEALGSVLFLFKDACKMAMKEMPEGKQKQVICRTGNTVFRNFEIVIGDVSGERELAAMFAQESRIINRLLGLMNWQRRSSHVAGARQTIQIQTSHALMFQGSVMLYHHLKTIDELKKRNAEVPDDIGLRILSITKDIRQRQKIANRALKKIAAMDPEVLRGIGLRKRHLLALETTNQRINHETQQCIDDSREYRAAARRPEGKAQRKQSPKRRNKRPDVYFEGTSSAPSSSSRSGSDQYPPSETSRRSRRAGYIPGDTSTVSSRTWSSNTSSASDGTQYFEICRPTRPRPRRQPTTPPPTYGSRVRDTGHGVSVEHGMWPDVLVSPNVHIANNSDGNVGSPSSEMDSSMSRDHPQGKARDKDSTLGLPTEVEPIAPLRTGSKSGRKGRHGAAFGPSGLFTQEDLEWRRRQEEEEGKGGRSDDSSD